MANAVKNKLEVGTQVYYGKNRKRIYTVTCVSETVRADAITGELFYRHTIWENKGGMGDGIARTYIEVNDVTPVVRG